MLRILWNSKSGMTAQQEKLDSISNNIANLNTTAYKKTDVSFRDMVYEKLNRKGYPTSAKSNDDTNQTNQTNDAANNTPNNQNKIYQTGSGIIASEMTRDTSQGDVRETGVNTDLGIQGDGYFKVTAPGDNGNVYYTRDGSFNVQEGNLVDKNGYKLDITFDGGDTAKVAFTSDNFQVDEKGDIYLKQGNDSKKVGRVNLYTTASDESFVSSGGNLYSLRDGADVKASTDYRIKQGALEHSNVDMATEMTDMLVTTRTFQLNSKGISTADEMWGMVNNLRK